ncbi:hypothetical protein [Entomobacter blattae]|uniref:Uncharacterized protein n=1 Tax=Entomobacter blattae TaxID=2762277 RepID=A0A7H1NNY5_9PROT|nr:hypothetical protein [Entomobacter blattae]QNT77495.1 hypothetical protein JGUZn3_02370 [Entomobacter blattae]
MPSSTSNSDSPTALPAAFNVGPPPEERFIRNKTNPWKSFVRIFLLWAASLLALLYGFIILIDPWGMLPYAPNFQRIPISSNARYSLPMLATTPAFDTAFFGTSTSRLLEPLQFNSLFSTHAVNLSMNSATPWETYKMFNLFLYHHPQPKAIVIGLDASWCMATKPGEGKISRPFPAWMYSSQRWKGYFSMANMYSLQEAFNQFLWLIGAKKQEYGLDGYTRFVPPESHYNPKRVDQLFAEWAPVDNRLTSGEKIDTPSVNYYFPKILATLPPTTLVIVWFPPFSAEFMGRKGSWVNEKWQSCKNKAVSELLKRPHTLVVDFAYPNPWTQTRKSFWDPIHYRVPIARDIVHVFHTARQSNTSFQPSTLSLPGRVLLNVP